MLSQTGRFPRQAYVEFEDEAGAQRARTAMHGRLFAGNPVLAAHITESAWAAVPETAKVGGGKDE
jgi:RNA recognition motif-containing protein